MSRTTKFLLIMVVGAWAGVAIYASVDRVVGRALFAIERHLGDALYVGMGAVVAIAVAVVVIGRALTLVRRWWLTASFAKPDRNGRYPAIPQHLGYQRLDHPAAQTLGALQGRPTAAVARSVVTAFQQPAALLAAPGARPADDVIDADFRVVHDAFSAPIPRALSIPVGSDAAGGQVAIRLQNLAGVIVGGVPGAGKSNFFGQAMVGLLRQDSTGERVQFGVIDTKRVDFSHLPPLRSMVWPVAKTSDEALARVLWMVEEMERRFSLLERAGARHLMEYNSLVSSAERLPHLVIFHDEILDMTTNPDYRTRFLEAATLVMRRCRAAGMTYIMGTQLPKADVIDPSLRNLADARVAFRVTRPEDSRAIGVVGAEKLPRAPGRCIVEYDDVRAVQSYNADMRLGGRFDTFMASAPHCSGFAALGSGMGTGTGAGIPQIPASAGPDSGIPLFSTDDRDAPYTPEQMVHIVALFRQTKSDRFPRGRIKEVQRQLYGGQEGGHWFYRLRAALKEAGELPYGADE